MKKNLFLVEAINFIKKGGLTRREAYDDNKASFDSEADTINRFLRVMPLKTDLKKAHEEAHERSLQLLKEIKSKIAGMDKTGLKIDIGLSFIQELKVVFDRDKAVFYDVAEEVKHEHAFIVVTERCARGQQIVGMRECFYYGEEKEIIFEKADKIRGFIPYDDIEKEYKDEAILDTIFGGIGCVEDMLGNELYE